MKIKYYLSLFRQASKLDIFDLAYEFSSESLNTLSLAGYWLKVNGLLRKGTTVRIGIFFWHFYKSLIGYWRRRGAAILNETPFPFVSAYALSYAYLPLVVIHFLKAKGYKKKTFGYIFDQYWLSYGLYITARMWFRRQKPRAFVQANYTYSYHRVLHKAACDEYIPTFFLQHASLPDNIPPLQSDYALLEGQDALNKLAHAGTTPSRIFLIGMPKLDAHLRHINVQAQVRSIGICTNDLDPLLRAEQLLARIRQEFAALPLILRPHNADLRVSAWQDLARRYGIELSDSRTGLSFDFLRRVDAIIVGDSNLLLEAALVDVVPLYYDFAERKIDWYGFQRHGLVPYFSEPQQVCHCIEEISVSKPPVWAKAKLYCATVGTRYDGHSDELAAALIQSLVSGAQVDRSIWKRIPDIGLEAYELEDDRVITIGNRSL